MYVIVFPAPGGPRYWNGARWVDSIRDARHFDNWQQAAYARWELRCPQAKIVERSQLTALEKDGA